MAKDSEVVRKLRKLAHTKILPEDKLIQSEKLAILQLIHGLG
jgi:hypothetical protein